MKRTLQNPITFSGIGIHTGTKSTVTLEPSDKMGLWLQVADRCVPVRITEKNFYGGLLGSNVVTECGEVRTIEHLLSAIYGIGITACLIKVDGQEIPILDGSSSVFLSKLERAGTLDAEAPCVSDEWASIRGKALVFSVSVDDKSITLTQRSDSRQIFNLAVDFPGKVFESMPKVLTYEHCDASGYKRSIARARTFGFEKDYDAMLKAGLCKGANLGNAILIGESIVINEGGLRQEDELVAHKLLDIIGDLSPVLPYLGGFELTANKTGHKLNNQLLQQISEKLRQA